jgi:hypothetical protein
MLSPRATTFAANLKRLTRNSLNSSSGVTVGRTASIRRRASFAFWCLKEQ